MPSEAHVRKALFALGLVLVFQGVSMANHKDQPYGSVRYVIVKSSTEWTSSLGGYSSFTSCSWTASTVYCGQSVYGPRSVYHVAVLAASQLANWTDAYTQGPGGHLIPNPTAVRWSFEVGCVAKWRWNKCAPLRPGQYAVRIKGTDMVFKDLTNGVDYNKHFDRTYHILAATPGK